MRNSKIEMPELPTPKIAACTNARLAVVRRARTSLAGTSWLGRVGEWFGQKAVKVLLVVMLSFFAFGGVKAWAFGGSEDEILNASIQEAIERARGFKAHRARLAREEAERVRNVAEVFERRRQEALEHEAARLEYVRTRPSGDVAARRNAQLEARWEAERRREEKVMEAARLRYIAKRDRVRHILQTQAQIDEAEEYGLTQQPKPVAAP